MVVVQSQDGACFLECQLYVLLHKAGASGSKLQSWISSCSSVMIPAISGHSSLFKSFGQTERVSSSSAFVCLP
jgi:hypothetical protein